MKGKAHLHTLPPLQQHLNFMVRPAEELHCLFKQKKSSQNAQAFSRDQDRNHAESNDYKIELLSFSFSFIHSATVQTLLSQRAWIWEQKE